MPRSVWALIALLPAVLPACGSSTDPAVPATVTVSPSSQIAQTIGATFQFSAQVTDASGNTLTGRAITWSSTDPAVASVDSTGLATAVGLGETTIRATVEGVTGTATMSVDLEPAEVQKVAGDGQVAPALSILPVDPQVRVLDSGGNPIPGATVTFEVVSGGGVLNPTTATTDAAGEATTEWTLGLDEGTQLIRARSGSEEADFAVTATEPLLAVSTLSLADARATLSYGQALQAVGGSSPYSWNVTGGSPPAGISVATDGALSGTAGSLGSSTFTVQVTDAVGDTASRTLTLQVCDAPLSLSAGDVHLSNPAPLGTCAPFLPAGSSGDRYRVGVVRTTLSDGLEPGESAFLARATVAVREPGAATAPSRQTRRGSVRFLPEPPPELARAARRQSATAAFHRRMLEDGVRLINALGTEAVAPNPGPRSGGAFPRLARAAADPPDRILLRPYSESNSCSGTAPAQVPAELVAFNDMVAIYQDSVQRASDPTDAAHATTVLDYFEAHGWSTINEYFGGLTDINSDERVTVFVSPVVPSMVAAFVWPGDFLLNSECGASNEQELIYFGEFMFDDIADDNFQALPVMVHEMKHVSSLYLRLVSNDFHPVWVEEGSAEIAAEISSRKAMEANGGVAQGALLTRSAFPPMNIADEHNFGVLIRLSRLTRSYSSSVNSLTDDPNESPDHTFYGTSWHFHRFLGDAYGNAAGQADGAFFTLLNDSATAPGPAGFVAVTGTSTTELLEEYAAAMMLNGTGAPEPSRRFTTYEFPTATDIFVPEAQPPGAYPWPETGPTPLAFTDGDYEGDLAPGGLRVHEFESDGVGDGIEVRATIDTGAAARVVIVRVN